MKLCGAPYSNYKTQLCKFWVEDGKCRYKQNCSYAHGDAELRKPYEPVPPEAAEAFAANQISAHSEKAKPPQLEQSSRLCSSVVGTG
mmetsp:Transcript_3561/g.5368  ORF Transcript_3561/g.5368 Transcript_3561/m.5368 type:complete len:87 (-) Transcript_3561:592-852(-)